jgi:hypothetical protein
MDKYTSAQGKLSAASKAAMDNEYQSMKDKGRIMFKSKVTGLDYTIPENVKGKGSKAASKPASVSVNPITSNPMVDALSGKKSTGSFSLDRPKDMKYANPTGASTDRLQELSKLYDDNQQNSTSGDDIKTARKSEKKVRNIDQGTIKDTSHINTLNNILGSTAIARFGSELANKAISPVLSKIDGVLGTNLDGKETFGQHMDETGLNASAKSILYKIADKKAQRTGKNEGSITYEDYRDVLPKEDYEALMDSKSGKDPKVIQAAMSLSSPGVDLGLTVGGANYKKDPATGRINISDSYDFINSSNKNKDGSFKKGWVNTTKKSDSEKAYFDMHDASTMYDIGREKKSGFKNRNMNFNLTPADTVGRTSKDKEASALAKLLSKIKK